MSVGFVRPNSSRLMLHVYGRSVHPELFRIFAETEITQEGWSATLRICDTGHTINFRYQGHTVTELTASRDQLLPQKKRFLEKSLRGCRDEAVRFEGGLRYSLSYHMERLEPNVFLNFHEELSGDCKRAAVAYRFPVENRLSPEPLSLLRTEAGSRSLLIHAFHTFPGSCSVLKTQSLFEL
ncbi:MAG TPA: DUF2617 family protein [Planctomycetaceae bacterium]|nr:DUF2617 family protein [Planctomycetaceae bacterium]